MNIIKNVADLQSFILCAHCHDLKIVLEDLILRSLRACEVLCKLVNYLPGARSFPSIEQVEVSGNELTGNEMIEIYLDVALQVKNFVSG